MNADRVAATVADRAATGGVTSEGCPALGTVIISLQQTQMDSKSALRIFARIDDVMNALAAELDIKPAVPPCYLADPRTVHHHERLQAERAAKATIIVPLLARVHREGANKRRRRLRAHRRRSAGDRRARCERRRDEDQARHLKNTAARRDASSDDLD